MPITRDQPVVPDLTRVQRVLNDACQRLLAEQQPDGTWHGAIMYNAWTNGMFCILQRLLGEDREPTAALDWLEAHRSGQGQNGQPNGTWGVLDIPSPSFLEGTIAAEIALEIWGRGPFEEAWAYIDEQASGRLTSGIGLADPFTQSFATLASPWAPPGRGPYYDISEVLAPPLELLLLPRVFASSLPHLAGAWGQDALLALIVIATIASGRRLNIAELALLKKAEAQLLDDQNSDGSWYCTFLPTIAGTLAMHLLGYGADSPTIKRATDFISRLERADGYVARYKLPVWDTSIAILGLTSAGTSAAAPPLRRAGDYLLDAQTDTGGIPFQQENALYPDTDDTSYAVLALDRLDMGEREREKRRVMVKAVRWLGFMQGDDGGWAAFAKNQQKAVRGLLPVFKDDPATADVTGHVLSALALGPTEPRACAERTELALSWLEQMQLDQGGWFGRWGLTFTYGTAAVLMALRDLAAARAAQGGAQLPPGVVESAVGYLLSKQRPDGGWGEGYPSYYDFNAQEDTPSTVEQTAWTVLGLLAVPRSDATESAIARGVDFLLSKYDRATGWPRASYSVGAIWVYYNSLYPLLWGTWALAEYLRAQSAVSARPVASPATPVAAAAPANTRKRTKSQPATRDRGHRRASDKEGDQY